MTHAEFAELVLPNINCKGIYPEITWFKKYVSMLISFDSNGIPYFDNKYQEITIYCLINPIDNSIFYVGRTTKPLGKRVQLHVCPKNSGGSAKKEIVSAIIKAGRKLIIRKLETIKPISDLEYKGTHERELFWIGKLKSEGQPIKNLICRSKNYEVQN